MFVRKIIPRLLRLLSVAGVAVSSTTAMASAFQIWEQDAASVGNFHAGYAAAADNASTAFYNPAGLTLFNNQQLVIGGAAVLPSVKYRGTVAVSTHFPNDPLPVTAQGGKFAFVPFYHFVSPINDVLAFGFSATVPFGLSTQYGNDTIIKYAATTSGVTVLDLSPVLGVQLTDNASIGFGPDFQIMKGEFDQVGTYQDTLGGDGVNDLYGTAWGYHLGWLYKLSERTRFGLSYHSQVAHHLRGDSTFSGSFTDVFNDKVGVQSDRARLNITLPPYVAASFYHQFKEPFTIMASTVYTKWSVIDELTLQHVAGVLGSEVDNDITVSNPQYFHNSWSFSIGGDYQYNEDIKLRMGLGFDQSPVQQQYRDVKMPDNDRYVLALGGHYQLTSALGLDAAWTHFFIKNAHINPPTQHVGDEEVDTNGQVIAGADAFALQLIWDIV